jgi:DeoR family fructose operon transcriptional repressor
VRHHSLAMIGPLTVASLTKLHADLAFLGATGASLKHGLCTPNIIEAETKAGMVEAAAEAIALVDHTKIGQASLAPYAAWTDVARLVTDLPLPAEFAERIGSLGVAVTVAAPREQAGTELPELEAAGGA